jgi:hypothetical protein
MAGNIQRRLDGKGRARYRDTNHREHARHIPAQRDAERWLASQEVAIARGEWVDPTLSKIMVGENGYRSGWRAKSAEASHDGPLRVALRRQIVPRWELVPLGRITHSDVSSWVHSLTVAGLAPATVRLRPSGAVPCTHQPRVRDGRLVRNVAEGVLSHVSSEGLSAYLSPRPGAGPSRMPCAPYGSADSRVLAYGRFCWWHVPQRAPGDLVFTAPEGGVLRNTNFRPRFFDPAPREGGAAWTHPHEPRHTAASLACGGRRQFQGGSA